ncbi:MAG: hypothetical protein B7X43_00230 [Thiomonas sp. 15-63-373]|nr:MAG: hypothetical protein B7X43_00230 [Thiomonas sp. 15-63-373]
MDMESMVGIPGIFAQQGAGTTTGRAMATCIHGRNANAQTNAQKREKVRKERMGLDGCMGR